MHGGSSGAGVGLPNWWESRSVPEAPPGYGELVEAMRLLQDRLAAAAPDAALVTEVTREITRAAALLAPAETDEWSAPSGRVEGLPSHGAVLIPPVRDVVHGADDMRGTVRFGRYYLGGNGAVHGGAIPLMFDDLMGRFANRDGRPAARTAYLNVDYRSITPIGTDLTVEVRTGREEGRKRFVSGVLRDGDRVCAEAEGLFVQLRPGQS
ncbi:PaaI family thioesterase [Pseudonocardia ailaonensis]|uniref:Acyl-coenzyme A thioesterase THEM4 n=1 Tax=Pseudonocardia ailaonensis TaxID=367279 RepID=A0ABN2NFD0_9PSEU